MIKPSVILTLLVLLALLAAGVLLFHGDRPDVKAPGRVGSRIMKDALLDKITAIDIQKDGHAVHLEKKDKTWVLASHKNRPAKMERIDQLVMDAGGALIEGTREGKLETFGLDEKGTTKVTFTSRGKEYALLLGKSPDYAKTFVKTDANSPIYEVDKGLDMSAGIRTEKEDRVLDPSYFYDLKLLSVPADDIIDIKIEKGKDSVRVRRAIVGKGPIEPKATIPKDAKLEWLIVEPEKEAADEGAVNRITNQFITLNMKKYADDVSEKDMGLDAPSAKITIRTKDGSERELAFGKINGEDVFAALKGRDDKFVVFKFTYDNVALTLKDLKKKPEPKASVNNPKPKPAPDFEKNLSPEEKAKIHQAIKQQMKQPPVPPKPAIKKEVVPPPPPLPAAQEHAQPKAPPAVIRKESATDKAPEAEKPAKLPEQNGKP